MPKDPPPPEDDEPLELLPADDPPPRRFVPIADSAPTGGGEAAPAAAPAPASPEGQPAEEPVRTAAAKAAERREREAPPAPDYGEWRQILAWPLKREARESLILAGGVLVTLLLVAAVFGWLLSFLPILGPWFGALAHTGLALFGLVVFFDCVHQVVAAALRGRLVVQRVFATGAPRDGLRLTVLLILYLLPGILAGLAPIGPWLPLLIGLPGWLLFPAAAVRAIAHARALAGHPFAAFSIARDLGRPGLLSTLAPLPFVVARILLDVRLAALVLEILIAVAIAYALLVTALLARTRPRSAARLAP